MPLSWKDLWELLLDIENELPDNFTARHLLDALQRHATEKMLEDL